MQYKKLKVDSLKNIFIREIQEKIFFGELKSGEQLPPEREIADKMGISRSIVNAGLLELESQGFVRRIPRRGTVVEDYEKNGTLQILVALMNYDSTRINYPLFESMMDMRCLIECESAHQAAGRITEDEASSLRSLAAEIGGAGSAEDALEPLVLFHYRLTQLSGNREKSAECARACLNQGVGALRKQYKKEGKTGEKAVFFPLGDHLSTCLLKYFKTGGSYPPMIQWCILKKFSMFFYPLSELLLFS